jgi:hypothetical protein
MMRPRFVDEGDAVEEERRGKPAEDEVLETRFLALFTATVACGENVEREAQGFEAEEQHDEILCGHHDDAADRGSEVQNEEFGAVFTFAHEVVARGEAREQHRDTDRDGAEHRKVIERKRISDDRFRSTVAEVVPQEETKNDRRGCGCGADDAVKATRPLRQQRTTEHEDARAGEEREQRAEGEPRDRRTDEGFSSKHRQPPCPSESDFSSDLSE